MPVSWKGCCCLRVQKIELKWRAWSCQSGSWVRMERGELGAGGSPARNRAVSLAVVDSALTGATAFSAKATSRSKAAIILRVRVPKTRNIEDGESVLPT